jgi:hypothetical protein
MFSINLGGEGEVAGVLNQQPAAAAGPHWKSVSAQSLHELIQSGCDFLLCPNDALALPNGCADVVHTNNVPIDRPSILGDSAYLEVRWRLDSRRGSVLHEAMNTFHDLFRQPTRMAAGSFPADRRPDLFPGFVERSPRLHLWSPGDPIADTGPRLLIGVATWSGYDLNLLDVIEEAPAGPVHVDVFDVDSIHSAEDLFRFVPGLAVATTTPFVGLWQDGKLQQAASGKAARDLVVRVLHLPAEELDQRMSTVLARK